MKFIVTSMKFIVITMNFIVMDPVTLNFGYVVLNLRF